MPQLTGIEWTDMSANPIRAVRKSDGKRGHACIHASPGCIHCYSERWNGWRGTGLKFNVPSLALVDIILDQKELARMRKIKEGNKVFVCDMTDLFGPFVPDTYLDQVFGAMEANTGAIWQVLTKRPERMAAYLRQRWGDNPPVHFWCGCSIENQEYADKRIPHLLKVPARVRFLSCEPLLGEIDLSRYIGPRTACGECGKVSEGDRNVCESCGTDEALTLIYGEHQDDDVDRGFYAPDISWLICGGESGYGARPMHPSWARALRDQCQDAGIAYFFKQHGEYIHETQVWQGANGPVINFDAYSVLMTGRQEPADRGWQHEDRSISYRVGKHAAGRLLDGVEWNEFPDVAGAALRGAGEATEGV